MLLLLLLDWLVGELSAPMVEDDDECVEDDELLLLASAGIPPST